MNIIIPQKITRSMVVENTIPENVLAWNSLTNYAEDDLVVYNNSSTTTFPRIYQSLQGTNLGNIPDIEDTLWWQEVSYSNAYALFDGTNNLQSITNNLEEVVLKIQLTDGINSLALVNSEVGSIEVLINSTDRTLYSNIFNYNIISNWYNWVTVNSNRESNFLPIIVKNLPNWRNSILTIKIKKPTYSSTIKLGELIIGNLFNFGFTQRGISAGIVDYSIKTTDSFGNVNLQQRNFSKRISCQILANNKKLNTIQKVLYNLRTKPVVWIPTDDTNVSEATIVYGYYKDFSAELSYPDYTVYNLEIEGLI